MTGGNNRWILLRTSGGQTLPLARSLAAAGFDVWTPARTIRKVLRPGKRTEQKIEVDIAILPTFVFARQCHEGALVDAAAQEISPHPAFSVFCHAGIIPKIADRDIIGLREGEAEAAATMQAMRDADTHAEAECIRIAAIKSERARRRALKEMQTRRPAFAPGTPVMVTEMPALAGVTGVVETSERAFASVRIGNRLWKIEGWRLTLSTIDESGAPRSLAA